MSLARLFSLVGLALAAGCAAPVPPTPAGPGTEAEAPILVSLTATTSGADSVRFTLQVTNPTAEPIELHYPSGQTFDFSVWRAGESVWRWSAARSFIQALRTETLAPGRTVTHEAAWAPAAPGEYTVRGELTALNAGAAQTVGFRVE